MGQRTYGRLSVVVDDLERCKRVAGNMIRGDETTVVEQIAGPLHDGLVHTVLDREHF